MSNRSWGVTLTPLIVYLIGFAFSVVTGQQFTDQQAKMLEGLLYAFIGSGAIGGAKAAAVLLKK